jgi:nitroreductase
LKGINHSEADPMTLHAKIETETAALRLAERYGAPTPIEPPVWNGTLDLLLAHRSVRRFIDRPIPEGTVETLVACAQSAPTSSNLQTWSVVAVEEPGRKARLSVLAGDQAFIRDAPLFLVWVVDQRKLMRVAQAQGREALAFDYLETFLLGAVDTSLAAQNATVAAEALGLGATYVGGIRNKPAEVAAELGLEPHMFALFGMAVGWPDPDAGLQVKPRLPQDAVLFREQSEWCERRDAAVTDYNPRLRAFQRRQAMAEQDWTAQALNRTAGPQSMAGRHVLREVLERLGFVLR